MKIATIFFIKGEQYFTWLPKELSLEEVIMNIQKQFWEEAKI